MDNCAKAIAKLETEINTSRRTSDWIVEIVTHPRHVLPDVGATPQDVIDTQIGEDFDLFIMLLWTRIGSKLPSGLTGLEHEFQKAAAKREADGQRPILAVFFCDAPIQPSRVDCDQLRGVQQFKTAVQKSVYYKTFSNSKNLTDQVKDSLRQGAELPRRKKATTPKASGFDDLSKPLPGLVARVRKAYPEDEG